MVQSVYGSGSLCFFLRSPSCSGPTPDVCAADILPKVLGSIMFVLMPGSRAQRNVAPLLMMGGPPPPEQLPFLINAAASPKFAAQLKSYGTLESI